MSLVAFKKGGMTPGLHPAPSLIMSGVQEAATNKRAIEKVKMQNRAMLTVEKGNSVDCPGQCAMSKEQMNLLS